MAAVGVTTMLVKVNLKSEKNKKKIKKVLCKIPEIENQMYDEESNTMTITVVSCCPEKIKKKIFCKGGCIIIDIVPPPPPPPRPPPPPPPPPPCNCCKKCCVIMLGAYFVCHCSCHGWHRRPGCGCSGSGCSGSECSSKGSGWSLCDCRGSGCSKCYVIYEENPAICTSM